MIGSSPSFIRGLAEVDINLVTCHNQGPLGDLERSVTCLWSWSQYDRAPPALPGSGALASSRPSDEIANSLKAGCRVGDPTATLRRLAPLATKLTISLGEPRTEWATPCQVEWPFWVHRRVNKHDYHPGGTHGLTCTGPWRLEQVEPRPLRSPNPCALCF